MAKNFPMQKWPAILGLLIAVTGIATPILWDFLKSRSILELRQLEGAVIIQKQDELKKLKILYGNEELDSLTRFRFRLSNTGTTPIVAADVIKPLTINFKGDAKILDTEIEAVYPRNLEATVNPVDNESCVQLGFSLLNQGDNITFSLLIANYSATSFDASARIVGVEELSIVIEVSEPKRAAKPTRRSLYIVGALSLFCLLGAGICSTDIRPEITFKRALKHGKSIIPRDRSKEHLLTLVRSKLSWTASEERAPVLAYIEGLPGENVSEEECQHIEELVKSTTEGATSNVTVAIVFALLGAIGVAYVAYQVL